MNEFIEYLIHDLLGSVTNVTARAMFGGHGIYKSGKIFAIVIDQKFYLKADDALAKTYAAAGAYPFTYQREGKTYSMKYFCVPESILEHRETLLEWARWSIALPTPTTKKKKR